VVLSRLLLTHSPPLYLLHHHTRYAFSLLISLTIPGCGFCGVRRHAKPLLGCFAGWSCGFGFFSLVASCVLLVGLLAESGVLDGGPDGEKNGGAATVHAQANCARDDAACHAATARASDALLLTAAALQLLTALLYVVAFRWGSALYHLPYWSAEHASPAQLRERELDLRRGRGRGHDARGGAAVAAAALGGAGRGRGGGDGEGGSGGSSRRRSGSGGGSIRRHSHTRRRRSSGSGNGGGGGGGDSGDSGDVASAEPVSLRSLPMLLVAQPFGAATGHAGSPQLFDPATGQALRLPTAVPVGGGGARGGGGAQGRGALGTVVAASSPPLAPPAVGGRAAGAVAVAMPLTAVPAGARSCPHRQEQRRRRSSGHSGSGSGSGSGRGRVGSSGGNGSGGSGGSGDGGGGAGRAGSQPAGGAVRVRRGTTPPVAAAAAAAAAEAPPADGAGGAVVRGGPRAAAGAIVV
jgi:hypothetical protein